MGGTPLPNDFSLCGIFGGEPLLFVLFDDEESLVFAEGVSEEPLDPSCLSLRILFLDNRRRSLRNVGMASTAAY